ncbi:MAG: type II secretion system GspH family protein [Candidatus Magasanikbacteria bacterium]|nr:type II secretion system GspH family protein [Candidatus Magasanikbacteria bacterium]
MKQKGFTTIEIIVAMSIFLIISAASFGIYTNFQNVIAETGLKEVGSVINSAANKARNGLFGTSWGIYFPYDEVTRKTETAVIFSGDSYGARDTSKDINIKFTKAIEFINMSVSGSGSSSGNDHEIVFLPFSADTSQYGEILVQSFGATSTIIVSKDGFITWK